MGWAVGMVYGTIEAYQVVNPVTGKHFGGSLALIPGMEQMGYIAVTAFVINVVIAVVLTAILNALKVSNGKDETIPFDYFADADDPRVAEGPRGARHARRAVRRPGRHPGQRAGTLGRTPPGPVLPPGRAGPVTCRTRGRGSARDS